MKKMTDDIIKTVKKGEEIMKLSKALKYIILAAGIVLIVVGAATGEAQSVFLKAIRICLECIGIG